MAFAISIGVGYCLYPLQGNARSLPMDKDNKFPHLIVFIKSRTEGTGGRKEFLL
jgi:hypothetical protein